MEAERADLRPPACDEQARQRKVYHQLFRPTVAVCFLVGQREASSTPQQPCFVAVSALFRIIDTGPTSDLRDGEGHLENLQRSAGFSSTVREHAG